MNRSTLLLLALSLAACGGSSSPGNDAAVTSDAGSDSGAAVDAFVPSDTGPAALHGCTNFTDFSTLAEADRMIMVPRGTDTFDNPCVSIHPGQTIMFMWDFSLHPLEAGVAPGMSGTGTTPTPIVPQTTGVVYTATFPDAGDYPFYCGTHFATGMVGVVHVAP